MYYFTISEEGLLDSINKDYHELKRKFPNQIIFKSEKPLKTINLQKVYKEKVKPL